MTRGQFHDQAFYQEYIAQQDEAIARADEMGSHADHNTESSAPPRRTTRYTGDPLSTLGVSLQAALAKAESTTQHFDTSTIASTNPSPVMDPLHAERSPNAPGPHPSPANVATEKENACRIDDVSDKTSCPSIHIPEKDVTIIDRPALITPPSIYGKRVLYAIVEYTPLLDSCNMTMSDWCRIAADIELNYHAYDGFVVVHGTDTISYTSSALSFILENLGKTVILTGSQVYTCLANILE